MQLRTNQLFAPQRNRIGHDHLRQTGLLDSFQCRPGEHCVGTGRHHFPSPVIHTGLRPFHDGARRIDHVVEQQHALPLHVSDDVHDLRLIRPFAALVDDGQIRLKPLRERAGPFHSTGIGRDDHQVARPSSW